MDALLWAPLLLVVGAVLAVIGLGVGYALMGAVYAPFYAVVFLWKQAAGYVKPIGRLTDWCRENSDFFVLGFCWAVVLAVVALVVFV